MAERLGAQFEPKGTAMQAQGHDNGSGTELEHYDSEEVTTGQHRGGDKDLSRYDDDDVATAPWPPQLS
jgi:hypothetical protein